MRIQFLKLVGGGATLLGDEINSGTCLDETFDDSVAKVCHIDAQRDTVKISTATMRTRSSMSTHSFAP